MGYFSTTILDVAVDTTGTAYTIAHHKRLLFKLVLSGTVNCAIQAKQYGTSTWTEIQAFAATGELTMENHGWHEIRCVTTSMSGATANVEMSWNDK